MGAVIDDTAKNAKSDQIQTILIQNPDLISIRTVSSILILFDNFHSFSQVDNFIPISAV